MPSRCIRPSEVSSASLKEALSAPDTTSPRDALSVGAAMMLEPPACKGAMRTPPSGRTKRFVQRDGSRDSQDLAVVQEIWAQVRGVVSERWSAD